MYVKKWETHSKKIEFVNDVQYAADSQIVRHMSTNNN